MATAVIGMLGLSGALSTEVASGAPLAFAATHDTYVDSSSPSTVNGNGTTLRARNGTRQLHTYLTFTVSGADTTSGASLRLWVTDASPDAGDLYVVPDTSWTADTMTWANRKALAPSPIVEGSAVSAGTWATFDVGSVVTGNGTYSFALVSASDDVVRYGSSEATASTRPQLVVETDADPGGGGQPATVTPVADTYVTSASPSTANGSSSTLRTRGPSPALISYLRFTVSGVGDVDSAVLHLTPRDASPDAGTLYRVADTTWSESITYTTRPSIGAAIVDLGAVAVGTPRQIDVSAYVSGEGTYSFAIVGESSDAAHFASRETTTPPQLLINGGVPGEGGGALTNQSPPSVSAAAPLRSLYHALPGTWTGSGTVRFTYQWERCASNGTSCEPIGGATARRYVRTDADIGSSLRVIVTARDDAGTATAASPNSGVLDAAPTPPPGDPVVGVSADIACSPTSPAFNTGVGTATECRQADVSDLLIDGGLTAVLIPGDIQYEKGEYENFLRSYDLSWGRVTGITYPAPGNHEYGTSGATGYYDYFGPIAGDRSKGYYSFDIGTWHIIALNSNCAPVGGCGAGSAQEQWLRADLAAHPTECTLAYWHHPRFSSGRYGADTSVAAFWAALHDHGADLVLNGHEHHYERFAPQSPAGASDPVTGIRQIIVGTGGKSLRAVQTIAANSEVRNDHTYGALRLTLRPGSYAWEFESVAGGSFTDSGTTGCVGAPEATDAPSAAFSATPRSGGSPLSVSFVDLSTGRPTTWAWDFDGDGLPDSAVQHPQHVFTEPGLHSIALTATNGVGSGSVVRTNIVRVSATVTPVARTDGVAHSGDAADDPAIWAHPSDTSQSLVIGTDKASGGGLVTYDLSGATVQVIADGAMNNVDVRNGFPLGGTTVPIVVATQESDNTLATYAIDATSRTLSDVESRPLTPGVAGYGICLYHSPVSGAFHAFVTSKSGVVEQWRLFDDGAGKVDATRERSFDVGGQVEGCVADDQAGVLFVGEEDVGIWRFPAEPDGGTSGTLVDSTTGDGRLVADVEGLALSYGPGGGYLIASSQGDSTFLVYERGGTNAYVGSFRVGGTSTIDATTGTDGIDATATGLGDAFPGGLFVAQDNSVPSSTQNFKLVPLDTVIAAVVGQ